MKKSCNDVGEGADLFRLQWLGILDVITLEHEVDILSHPIFCESLLSESARLHIYGHSLRGPGSWNQNAVWSCLFMEASSFD